MVGTPPKVLITGATDGIGLELARIYQGRGCPLALIGRRPLDRLDGGLFDENNYCQIDLAKPYSDDVITRFLDERGHDDLDILLHNAGVGYYGEVRDQPRANIDELIAVNVETPMALTHRLLPRLAGTRGKVVMIGSVAASVPCPDYAVYSATKAAIDGFARSLRAELRGTVGVQVIHPGATRTGMHAKIGLRREIVDWERFPPAANVAAAVVRAIDSGGATVTIGWGNRLLRFAGRFLAPPLDWIQRKRRLPCEA